MAIRHWYESLPEKATTSVLPAVSQRILNCLKDNVGSTDSMLERIAKAATNLYIEDWNDKSIEEFGAALDSMKADIDKVNTSVSSGQKVTFATDSGIEERYYEFDPENISTSGHFFQSALDDMLDEYGDSIENNEKIGILMNMVKKLMG